VGRYEFEFEGFENLIVRTNQDEDDGISCFTSVGDLSFDDSAACDDYAPLRMSGTTSVDERDRFDGKIYASVVADDGFVHKQGVKELSLSAVFVATTVANRFAETLSAMRKRKRSVILEFM
jgi:hypothetical protein